MIDSTLETNALQIRFPGGYTSLCDVSCAHSTQPLAEEFWSMVEVWHLSALGYIPYICSFH